MKINGVTLRNSILLICLCHCTHADTHTHMHVHTLNCISPRPFSLSLCWITESANRVVIIRCQHPPSQNVINVILQCATAVIRLYHNLLNLQCCYCLPRTSYASLSYSIVKMFFSYSVQPLIHSFIYLASACT